MVDRLKERARLGHLTHAGVDCLEQLLSDIHIDLDAKQRNHIRGSILGPSGTREDEDMLHEFFEDLYRPRPSRSIAEMLTDMKKSGMID